MMNVASVRMSSSLQSLKEFFICAVLSPAPVVRGLVLTGPTGTGKSTLAVRLLVELRRRNEAARAAAETKYLARDHGAAEPFAFPRAPSSSFVTDRELIRELRAAMGRGAESHAAVIDRLSSRRLLALDDFASGGADALRAWEAAGLAELVDATYLNGNAILLTTNRSMGELASLFGARIPSRLHEMAEIVTVEGRDRRLPAEVSP